MKCFLLASVCVTILTSIIDIKYLIVSNESNELTLALMKIFNGNQQINTDSYIDI